MKNISVIPSTANVKPTEMRGISSERHQNVTRRIERGVLPGFQTAMKNDGQPDAKLGAGQLWRLNRRYVRIVALENMSVRFKLLDAPNQTEERTLTGERGTLWRYLLSRKGQLV